MTTEKLKELKHRAKAAQGSEFVTLDPKDFLRLIEMAEVYEGVFNLFNDHYHVTNLGPPPSEPPLGIRESIKDFPNRGC